jgi:hypothetical protein
MKRVLLIVELVLGAALTLALFVYWKNGRQPQEQRAAVHAPFPNVGPAATPREYGNGAPNGITPQPGLALGSPAASPPDWSWFLPWPYSRGWTGSDTLPAKRLLGQPPLRGNADRPPRQDLAVQ